jgi:hypothetical protein
MKAYFRDGAVPRSIRPGRVLMHNSDRGANNNVHSQPANARQDWRYLQLPH